MCMLWQTGQNTGLLGQGILIYKITAGHESDDDRALPLFWSEKVVLHRLMSYAIQKTNY